MRRTILFLVLAAVAVLASAGTAQAGVFYVGPADLADGIEDGLYMGSPVFAHDHLVVEVNGLVVRNQWNGMVAGGSGTLWHHTFLWDGSTITMIQSHGVVKTDGMPPYHVWMVRR